MAFFNGQLSRKKRQRIVESWKSCSERKWKQLGNHYDNFSIHCGLSRALKRVFIHASSPWNWFSLPDIKFYFQGSWQWNDCNFRWWQFNIPVCQVFQPLFFFFSRLERECENILRCLFKSTFIHFFSSISWFLT